MNHAELQRGFFEFETGALRNLSNEQAKSSLEESPSTPQKKNVIVGSSMSEVFGNKPKSNIISFYFN